ncbi:MAG: MarR family transcriptional regulator [Acidimicrobiia bacterium]|nr:MarR family transcriptional regulator [Acidimicrobiia bacterium]
MAADSSPARNTAAEDLAPRLRLAVARLHRRLRQSADPNLTLSQLSALASVERDGPITLGALARIEQVQPPTITALSGKLEAAGLLERTIDESDRRIHRVEITPAGAKLLEQHRKRKNAYLDRRLRRLTEADRAALTRAAAILERLAAEDPQ